MDNHIAVIDLKSFYASVECVLRGLDPLKAVLVVCDTSRGDGTIVLSASPMAKSKYGIKNIQRKRDLPNIPELIYATPRMETYVKISTDIVSIFLEYVGEDDLHIYSIDESFLNLGPYLKLYKCTAKELVKRIMDKIHDKLGLIATGGIGPNMILAKTALDIEAKHNPDFIAEWTEKDVPTKLWKIKPCSEMWGINVGIERRLNRMGIYDIGTLANFPIENLKEEFGVIGEQLWQHANGIDDTDIREKYFPKETSLSTGQVLFRDYKIKEAELILREMNEELCIRLRQAGKMTKQVGLYVMYSMESYGGFVHQMALDFPTSDDKVLIEAILTIYYKYVENLPIRRLNINFSKLQDDNYEQISLFLGEKEQTRRRNLNRTMDEIKMKYGKDSVLKASSLTEASTIKERHNQIGGHRK